MSNPASNASIRQRAFIDRRDCPMALAVDILGDRWTLLILREAFYGVQRYDDMLADLGAPRAMLTGRLSRLVEHGLMSRIPYKEPGSRVRHAYALTGKGRDTALMLIAMMQWGETHIVGRPAPVMIADSLSGAELRAGLASMEGRAVDMSSARLVRRQG